jgi:hypothetical protein
MEESMTANRLVVKYHNRRMLLTVDINALFTSLFRVYDDEIRVEFVPMNETEQNETTDAVVGMRVVRDRFQMFEVSEGGEMRRRADIEQAAIASGAK